MWEEHRVKPKGPVKLFFAVLEIHLLRDYGEPHYEKLIKRKLKKGHYGA